VEAYPPASGLSRWNDQGGGRDPLPPLLPPPLPLPLPLRDM